MSNHNKVGPPANDTSASDQEYLKGKIQQYLQVDDLNELLLLPKETE
jgi:hypothetical protein